ncbi:MAG: hypothetical protein IPM42_00560 [Saprospiraceae bacterium]|jgi:hypothetical protein|nr:hypothetical protein [Saprospiraceae bacterium]
MKNIFLFLLISTFFACKNDSTNKESESGDTSGENYSNKATNPADLKIPGACEMLTEEWIKTTLGLTLSDVTQKEADDPENKNARSCFFRWEDPSTPNAGIMIQIMTNPVYDEFDQWVSYFVNAKLSEGEVLLGSDEAHKYKKFDAGNLRGAYSYELKRFYWHLGNDYLYMLAFNLEIPESKMVADAKKIAIEVNKNFAAKVKS